MVSRTCCGGAHFFLLTCSSHCPVLAQGNACRQRACGETCPSCLTLLQELDRHSEGHETLAGVESTECEAPAHRTLHKLQGRCRFKGSFCIFSVSGKAEILCKSPLSVSKGLFPLLNAESKGAPMCSPGSGFFYVFALR